MKSDNSETLVNRVKKSPLVTLNLETYDPDFPVSELDLKNFLFKELLLKEKDFRAQVKSMDWTPFAGHTICVYCSNDAIVPVWAYMLIAAEAPESVREVYFGKREQFLQSYYRKRIQEEDWSKYKDGLIVIKGCSEKAVPHSAYLDLTAALRPYARSIMFGEACSTVPIYKKKKKSQ
jgi:hypothetical protein